MKFILNNLSQTQSLGHILANLASPGDVICLDGDLGAGKTTLTQAIARGLGVPEENYVTSPSFTILQEYEGRIPLYHMDFYRLGDGSEVEEYGFSEYFYRKGLCVIEWSIIGEDFLPEEHLEFRFTIDEKLRRCVEMNGSLKIPQFQTLFQTALEKANISIV